MRTVWDRGCQIHYASPGRRVGGSVACRPSPERWHPPQSVIGSGFWSQSRSTLSAPAAAASETSHPENATGPRGQPYAGGPRRPSTLYFVARPAPSKFLRAAPARTRRGRHGPRPRQGFVFALCQKPVLLRPLLRHEIQRDPRLLDLHSLGERYARRSHRPTRPNRALMLRCVGLMRARPSFPDTQGREKLAGNPAHLSPDRSRFLA